MSVVVDPPPYLLTSSSGLIDLKKSGDSLVMTTPSLYSATVQRELNTVLDSEKMKVLIDEEIRNLAEKTLKARSAFERIRILLSVFDSMVFWNTKNNPIEALRPGWDTLQTVSTNTCSSIIAH